MGSLEITVSEDPIQQQMADMNRLEIVSAAAGKAFDPVRDLPGVTVKVIIGYAMTEDLFLPIAKVFAGRDGRAPELTEMSEFLDPATGAYRVAIGQGAGIITPDWETAFAGCIPVD